MERKKQGTEGRTYVRRPRKSSSDQRPRRVHLGLEWYGGNRGRFFRSTECNIHRILQACEKWRREKNQECPEGFWIKWLGVGILVIRIQNVTTVGVADSALPSTKPISQPLIWNPREVTVKPVGRVFQGQSLLLKTDSRHAEIQP